MDWAAPEFSHGEVNRAGDILIDDDASDADWSWAFVAINNWRASHAFPLNTFQTTLRDKARRVYQTSLVAQRIKRLPSIGHKLIRYKNMRLSQMQDIGGCRAVLRSVSDVRNLLATYKKSWLKHKLSEEYDYISQPKHTGYRSVHLVYKYFSDKKPTYNGLRIEMQLRSHLQHAWATAVEVVDTMTRHALKSSAGEERWLQSTGEESWRRFFSLMGSALALRERTARIPDTPHRPSDLRGELRSCAASLNVEVRLRAYRLALHPVENPHLKDAYYFLLNLNLRQKHVTIAGYPWQDQERATLDYQNAERSAEASGSDIVLVSVDSLAALHRAYPNYFLDTSVFIQALSQALRE